MPALHKAWPGNNRFLCGCCVTGPGKDSAGIIFIYFCLVSMITTYTAFMFQTNWEISPVLPILYYASCFTFSLFVLLTSCSDPGIIPRRPFLMRNQEKFQVLLVKPTKGERVFCQTCLIYRPKQASHCATCQNCVQIFDHHCSILGNCIGRRNYRYFCMFIGNLIANFAIFVVNLAVYLINRESKAVNETVIIIIVSVIGGLIGLPILIFAFFHVYLCVTGRTTREVLKRIEKGEEQPEEIQWCFRDTVNINFFEQVQSIQIERINTEIKKMRNNANTQNMLGHHSF